MQKKNNVITQIFNKANGTDLKSLLKSGIVKTMKEFTKFYELTSKIFVHKCIPPRFVYYKMRTGGCMACVSDYLPGFKPFEIVYKNVYAPNVLICYTNLIWQKNQSLMGKQR